MPAAFESGSSKKYSSILLFNLDANKFTFGIPYFVSSKACVLVYWPVSQRGRGLDIVGGVRKKVDALYQQPTNQYD